MTALLARLEALHAVTGGPGCSKCPGPAETSIRIADANQKGGYYYAPVCRKCRAIAEADRNMEVEP